MTDITEQSPLHFYFRHGQQCFMRGVRLSGCQWYGAQAAAWKAGWKAAQRGGAR